MYKPKHNSLLPVVSICTQQSNRLTSALKSSSSADVSAMFTNSRMKITETALSDWLLRADIAPLPDTRTHLLQQPSRAQPERPRVCFYRQNIVNGPLETTNPPCFSNAVKFSLVSVKQFVKVSSGAHVWKLKH